MPFQKGNQLGRGKKGKTSNRKGAKLSIETKMKISRAMKGKSSWVGKKHTIETRIKMSRNAKRGVNSHFWRGGISILNNSIRQSLEYKLWRESVFKRDSYTCIWCKIPKKRIEADHIKPFAYYPELRFAIDNGRTLCVECHKKTDTYAKKI